MTEPVSVMIVEDSPVVRLQLESIISQDPRLKLVASVGSGEEALKQIPVIRPQVISMDINLPGMDGFETARRIMEEYPTPIVVVSSHVNQQEMKIGFNALRAGALSVLDKPPGFLHPDFDKQARALCTQLVIMSQVKVIRLRGRAVIRPAPVLQSVNPQQPCWPNRSGYEIMGIVASTGGPRALATLLSSFDAQFPIPILLIQHITPSFLGGFVDWLNTISPLRAMLAQGGEKPQPGCIYLAPAERHLKLRYGRLSLHDSELVSYQRPSGTVLLQSLAEECAERGIGVVLTGMGDDGAQGLKQMRDAGGYTLAEAESTAIVYGMPAVAAKLNAACQILPIQDIGPHLCKLIVQKEH